MSEPPPPPPPPQWGAYPGSYPPPPPLPYAGYTYPPTGPRNGLGITALVLAIIVSLIFIPIWIGVFRQVGGTDYVDCLSKAGSDQQAIQKCADQFRERVENQFSITVTPTP